MNSLMRVPLSTMKATTSSSSFSRQYWVQAGGRKPTGLIAHASKAIYAMNDDTNSFRTELKRRRFYEKPYQKRNRKIGESAIRAQNRKIGSMLDFIVKRKGQGF